jgi:ABC-type molybdenum transport system ATPase subunit/photorepair protein PhrA
MALPAHLSQHEKRIVAFVRAFLMRPRIMIYANCFEDVSLPLLPLFSQLVREFHSTLAERVSLYLSTTTDVASELKPDAIIHIHEPAEIFQRNT